MVLLKLLALFVGCSAVLFWLIVCIIELAIDLPSKDITLLGKIVVTWVCAIALSVSILSAYGLYYLVDYILR